MDTHNNVELVKHIHALLSEQQQTVCCLHGEVLECCTGGFDTLEPLACAQAVKVKPASTSERLEE